MCCANLGTIQSLEQQIFDRKNFAVVLDFVVVSNLTMFLSIAAYGDTRLLPFIWTPSPLPLMAYYFRRQKNHPDYQVTRNHQVSSYLCLIDSIVHLKDCVVAPNFYTNHDNLGYRYLLTLMPNRA